MNFTRKDLLDFFVDAFDQVVAPRLDRIENDLNDFKKKSLDFQAWATIEIGKIREDLDILHARMDRLERGAGSKKTGEAVQSLEKLVTKLKKELIQLTTRVTKFESALLQIKSSSKRKLVK